MFTQRFGRQAGPEVWDQRLYLIRLQGQAQMRRARTLVEEARAVRGQSAQIQLRVDAGRASNRPGVGERRPRRTKRDRT